VLRDCVRRVATVKLDGLRCLDDGAGWLLLCGGCTEELLLDSVLVHLVFSTEIGHDDATADDSLSGMRLARLRRADGRKTRARCADRGCRDTHGHGLVLDLLMDMADGDGGLDGCGLVLGRCLLDLLDDSAGRGALSCCECRVVDAVIAIS